MGVTTGINATNNKLNTLTRLNWRIRDEKSELKFEDHPSGYGGTRAIVFFDNGYGASVVFGSNWYSNGVDSWKIAVLRGNSNDWEICYDSGLTDDVFGYLDEDEANKVLSNIESLPKAQENKRC